MLGCTWFCIASSDVLHGLFVLLVMELFKFTVNVWSLSAGGPSKKYVFDSTVLTAQFNSCFARFQFSVQIYVIRNIFLKFAKHASILNLMPVGCYSVTNFGRSLFKQLLFKYGFSNNGFIEAHTVHELCTPGLAISEADISQLFQRVGRPA